MVAQTKSRAASEQPPPVDVPAFRADGSELGTRSFKPGPVRNYPNIALLKEAVRHYQGNLRQGTVKTKGRSEVAGSNKKPWRQKGTGRARAGRRQSPIWRGGGIVFGPLPRKYDYALPRKQRQLAIRHALLSKLLDGETRLIEGFQLEKPRARDLGKILETIGVRGSCLIGIERGMDPAIARTLLLSCRNLPGVKILPIAEADTLSILKHRSLVLTLGAFEEVQSRESQAGEKQ